MISKEKIICPNCTVLNNSTYIWYVFDPVDISNNSIQTKFCLRECNACNIRFKLDYYSEEQLNDYYSHLPKHTWKWEITNTIVDLFKIRKGIILKYINTWDILDVGCFAWDFLVYLWDTFKRFWLEPSDIVLPQWIEKYSSSLEEYDFQWKKFDLVTLLDVVEHIKKPKDFFDKIEKIVKDNWYILIDTWNYDSVVSKSLWTEWWYYNIIWHCTFWNYQSLKKILNDRWFVVKENLQTNRWDGLFNKHFFLAIIYKTFKSFYKYIRIFNLKINFLENFYNHAPPIYLYNDHILVLAQKITTPWNAQ